VHPGEHPRLLGQVTGGLTLAHSGRSDGADLPESCARSAEAGLSADQSSERHPEADLEALRARVRQLEQLVSLGVAWVLQAPDAQADERPVIESSVGGPIELTTTARIHAEIRRLQVIIDALAELEGRRQQVRDLQAVLRAAAYDLPGPARATDGGAPASWPTEDAGCPGMRSAPPSGALDERQATSGALTRPGATSVATRARTWGMDFVQLVVIAVVGFMAVRSTVQTFRVDGPSMLPTLRPGQVLLINRAVYWHIDGTPFESLVPATWQGSIAFVFGGVKRGDLVIFRAPVQRHADYVKRVIGLPGDAVLIRDERVFVNGHPLGEPYADRAHEPTGAADTGEDLSLTVPDGMYFVLGDNRPESFDSREGWLLPVENLIGRPWLSIWPPDTWGPAPDE
jgi:signal peptidase I